MIIQHEMKYRILYADTDAMGVMYYANYLRVYEASRGDFMRKMGFTFSDAELKGIVCPAIKAEVEYFRFAKFDWEVTIKSSVSGVPTSKLEFVHEMYDAENNLINRAVITLGFVNTAKFKAVRCPEWLAVLFNQE